MDIIEPSWDTCNLHFILHIHGVYRTVYLEIEASIVYSVPDKAMISRSADEINQDI
jgi:hypothetical protein